MIAKPFIFVIRLYQKLISPLLPPSCKYYPSCSAYAIEALEKFGLAKGSVMAIWRVLRCNPFSKGGYDPVVKDDCCSEHEPPVRRSNRK